MDSFDRTFYRVMGTYFALVFIGFLSVYGLYMLGYFHEPKVDYMGVVTGHTQIDCGACGSAHPEATFHLIVQGDDGKTRIVNVVEALSACPVGTHVHVTTGHVEGC